MGSGQAFLHVFGTGLGREYSLGVVTDTRPMSCYRVFVIQAKNQ
jgi:hypothetical protein